MLTFTEYRAELDRLESIMKGEGERLAALGANSGPMGLTPDAIKALPEYQAAQAAQRAAFGAIRQLNGTYAVRYRRELNAERDARRMAIAAGIAAA